MDTEPPLGNAVAAPNGCGYQGRTYLARDGLALYYRDYGGPLAGRPAVLCLAGMTRNSKDFHALARRLAEHRRVLCPDYRGRGRSAYDPEWRHYHPRTYVDDIRHLLAATGEHRVVVIGTSLGGLLAMAMAVAMPTAVAGAVLNDIGPEIGAEGLCTIIDYMRDDRPMADWEAATRRLRDTLPGLPARTDEDWQAIARAVFREMPDGRVCFDWDPAVVRPLLRIRGEHPDLWPQFRALRRVPLLAVRGAESKILSEATLRRMADEVPSLARLTVAGVGHPPALDEKEVLEAIDALLTQV